ncbi:MerR family transcriptional regulator [Vallitalea guaymasensis]|uniref:MerR family transcriptional regulator n=1 Tax=Vallitalea guaymasensis TaxID=1185412 RepID=UPI00272B2206|nr:MerR family transcriptional regulator [Vallitalea guaymasensis]
MNDNTNYRTGELSNFLGMSRDTLRYYEKKGILKPKQNEINNYREYNILDIYTLMVTEFYKKRGLAITDIKKLKSGLKLNELETLLDKKKRELEEVIRTKQLMLQKIEETQQFCFQLNNHLNKFSFRKLPLYEVKGEFSEWSAFDEYNNILNKLSIEEDIMTQFMKSISFDETGIIETKMYITKKCRAKNENTNSIYLDYPRCMYTVVEDGRYNNADDHIMSNMHSSSLEWAHVHGVKPIGIAFANTRLVTYHDNKERVFIEIFIPIE